MKKKQNETNICQRTKKNVGHENDGDINCMSSGNGLRIPGEKSGRIGNQKNRDHPDHSIVKIS